MNYNKFIGAGHLTKDPETKTLQNDTVLTEFGLAVNKTYQGKKTTMFIDCTAYKRTAENIAKYFKKGSNIFIEGELVFDQWTGKDGKKHSRHKVNVYLFTFVSDKSDRSDEDAWEPDNNDNAPVERRYLSEKRKRGKR